MRETTRGYGLRRVSLPVAPESPEQAGEGRRTGREETWMSQIKTLATIGSADPADALDWQRR